MMQQSMVRRAADEFARGNYLVALDLYRRLSAQLGERNFRANILLCENRVRQQGRRDCSDLPLEAVKVACVMDEFTFHCFEPECNLFPLTPEHAVQELEAFNPDLLFIESAWRGKDELWNRKIGTLSQELRAVLQWCKQRLVPTIFWNKEDPVHFETFLSTAQQFDFVFTTDIDCIARYKAALGHDRVYLLPFACQPRTHNPIELYPRKDAFCFAGAYYVRYPERTRDLETYLAEFPKYKSVEIFDRNFGKDDINYQFPPQYKPYIVGTLPFNDIDKAYKGYRYSINLNSIKQSQTMFARRVFELLGSNTITVSNFSRGVRLLFGDLVIASDSGKEIVDRLQKLDDEAEQKLRLAALRKVMMEHTYEQRLAYVARKSLGWRQDIDLPQMIVVSMVATENEFKQVLNNFKAQAYGAKRLVVVTKEGITHSAESMHYGIAVLKSEDAGKLFLGNLFDQPGWLVVMIPGDYYGPNYLLDLALGTIYCDAPVVGKEQRYEWTSETVQQTGLGRAYRIVKHLPVRASAIRWDTVPREQTLLHWLERADTEKMRLPGLSIDPFNYCQHGRLSNDIVSIRRRVDDLALDPGVPLKSLIELAEGIGPADFDETSLPKWSATRLQEIFGDVSHPNISIGLKSDGLNIKSTLSDGQHEYRYAKDDFPISLVTKRKTLETHLKASPGLDLQYVFIFLSDQKERISHVIHTANRNQTAELPLGAAFVRLGWRICGSGETNIKFLQLGHIKVEQARLLGRSESLLLTNHYPSYDDIYRNGFVHSRVKAYLDQGVHVDVFRLRADEATSYHEFQNVDVVTGSQGALRKLLDSGRYKRVLVHFLLPEMWEVLKAYSSLQIIVWVHGSEVQPWHRRDYNFQNEQERAKAIRESELRMAFWRDLLNPMPPNLKLVFVSRYFAEEVFEDIGFRVPEEAYTVIHNPIDTEVFVYRPKPPEQRKRVLSIRPYASRKYANDLSVKAILKLAEYPCFDDFEFRMIGDGKLFDETLEPLRKFSNVIIERRFLTHAEISDIHKDYGVCLTPTRMDAQGVSRDEAMSSGLVPVTNAVAAIPEFVDDTCGILAGPEDADGLAAGILALYENPSYFEALSRAAAERVVRQSGAKFVVGKELAVFKGRECK